MPTPGSNHLCPRCNDRSTPRTDTHPGGITLICRSCGHATELTHDGAPLPASPAQTARPQHNPAPAYIYGLAATPLLIPAYQTTVKAGPLTFVPASPDALYSVIIYHQPLRIPNTSSREPRRQPSEPTVRYVYAAEMHPFDPTLANPSRRENRQLRALLANEASRLTGLEMRNARSPWPITPPGTIMRTPLAPTTQP